MGVRLDRIGEAEALRQDRPKRRDPPLDDGEVVQVERRVVGAGELLEIEGAEVELEARPRE